MPQVLLVEDKDAGESSVGPSPAEQALRSAESFDLRRAHGAEAVLEEKELFRPRSGGAGPEIDILVTAHFLPRLNGLALTEELREAGADLPIMLLTSRENAAARAEALRRGADDCLSRPVKDGKAKELAARLRALLRRPAEWQPVKEIQVGSLLVDASRREAYAHGNRLDLRRKEFFLLYLLAGRSPEVVTREEIATRVWGAGVVSDNSIDVTTAGLRKELQGALSEEDGLHVETIRGVGYRLRPGSKE
jgi:DNA-binding response OmpR family regulator